MSTQVKIGIVVVLVVGFTAYAIYEKQSSSGTTSETEVTSSTTQPDGSGNEIGETDFSNKSNENPESTGSDFQLKDESTTQNENTSDSSRQNDFSLDPENSGSDSDDRQNSDTGTNGSNEEVEYIHQQDPNTGENEVDQTTPGNDQSALQDRPTESELPRKGNSSNQNGNSSLNQQGQDRVSETNRNTNPGTTELQEPTGDTATPGEWPKTHEVKPGENLWKISSKYYGSGQYWKTIKRANSNQIPPDNSLKKEMSLTIPAPPNQSRTSNQGASTPSDSARGEGPPGPAPSGYKWYKLKKGENLWKVAKKQLGSGTRYKEIENANSDRISDTDNIKAGTWLKIPTE